MNTAALRSLSKFRQMIQARTESSSRSSAPPPPPAMALLLREPPAASSAQNSASASTPPPLPARMSGVLPAETARRQPRLVVYAICKEAQGQAGCQAEHHAVVRAAFRRTHRAAREVALAWKATGSCAPCSAGSCLSDMLRLMASSIWSASSECRFRVACATHCGIGLCERAPMLC